MNPKFTMLELLLTMSASTRFAMTTRDVAGPQSSPLVGQSLSFWHLSRLMRHMPSAEVALFAKLHESETMPDAQVFDGLGVQVLAGPTQLFVSRHRFVGCWIWQV